MAITFLVRVTERENPERLAKGVTFLFRFTFVFRRKNETGMETSVLTSKAQLLIPKRLRNKYGIKSGVKWRL